MSRVCGSKLHLNRKGSAYLATIFLKALNTKHQRDQLDQGQLSKFSEDQSSSYLLDARPSINNYSNSATNPHIELDKK